MFQIKNKKVFQKIYKKYILKWVYIVKIKKMVTLNVKIRTTA